MKEKRKKKRKERGPGKKMKERKTRRYLNFSFLVKISYGKTELPNDGLPSVGRSCVNYKLSQDQALYPQL